MNLLERVKQQRIALSAPISTVTKLSHHPELDGRVHLYSSIDNNAGAVLDDFAGYARVYGVYPWVHKAITKIIDNIAALPVVVVNADGETQGNHWLTGVFANVNDTHSSLDLWAADVIHLMLAGESAIQVVPDGRGRPVELWARRPDLVGVSPDIARGRYPSIAKFIYDPQDGETPLDLTPEQMIWRKFLNPLNDYRGLAPIAAVREGIIIDLFAQQWSKGFLKNSARPDFALVAPQGITPTEKSDYEARFMRRHRGIDGAHLPVILEEGITDIKTFSFPPKDIEWLQQREYSRDEVGAIFGVPDEIMGYGRDTYENFQTALEVFWTLTLLPYVRRRDVALTTFFARHYAGILRTGERIETDVSEISTLQEDAAPKVDIATKLWRMGVSFNTLDERLNLGVGAVPGGEVAYVDSSVVPLEQIAATLAQMQTTLDNMRNPAPALMDSPDGDSAADDMQGTSQDDNADDVQRSAAWRAEAKTFRKWLRRNGDKDSSEFVAQHLTDSDKRAIVAEVADSSTAFFRVERPKCWRGHTIPDAAESVAAWKALVLQMDDGDDEAERRAREAIERAAVEDIAAALERQRRALLPANNPPDGPDVVARRVSETSGSVQDALRRALIESADLGVSVAVAQFDSIGYGFDWTLANTAARDWANRYTGELITRINETTREQVRQAVAAWVENGDPLPALIRELVPTFGRQRAELIASTEVTRAYAEANRLSYIESGVVDEIEWRTARDERVCPICGPLHQWRTDAERPDFDGRGIPPAHPRCRCWIVPVIADMAQTTTGAPVATSPMASGRAMGTPVSQSMAGPKRGAGRIVFDAVTGAIDSVHGDGELMPVPVKFARMTSRYGHYKFYPGTNKPVEIKISTVGDHIHQRMTLAHEAGHYLDEQVIKISRSLSNARINPSAVPVEYAEWLSAIDNTGTVQKLKRLYSGAEQIVDGVPTDKKYVRYLLRYDELWARSYAQYITIKSENAEMIGELTETLMRQGNSPFAPTQWDIDEFAPVVDAIDKIMRSKGWME